MLATSFPFFRAGLIGAGLISHGLGAELIDPGHPAPLAEAAQRMSVPEGFRVTLFAGEPDIVQPLAMTTDERGRLWVVECFSYPKWQLNGVAGEDRVIILEDRDGDGHFDTRKVFYEQGKNLTGIALGFGGVWLCSAPELIFIPDRNHDDVPDGPSEAVLDGWTLEAKHNIVNGLTWGPDGWLYGCHGILADSKIGKPGTPAAERVTINCGVWRYHPTRKIAEAVAHGTTNPWGIAFDDYGQMFIANCVIKHLFHVVPGGHYDRMYGQDINSYAFSLIPSIADHIHWAGGWWKTEGAEHAHNDAAGGGHAHCGALVYLGDNWPDRYRNTFFTLNVHGHRVNNDSLERRGSGYVARHQPDLLKANDAWFRGVALTPAADGSVFMSDWSDAGECHDYEDIHRKNGRIYKVTYGKPKSAPVNLGPMSDAELVQLQLHRNDWHVSQARRLLQERADTGKLDSRTRSALLQMLREQTDVTRQLRALWALHVTGGLEENLVGELLSSQQEWLRAWAIQLALEQRPSSSALRSKLLEVARNDPSSIVRLYLASGLQRLSLSERLPLAVSLAAHAEDDTDVNLPRLIWYGIEPIVATDDSGAIALLSQAQLPLVRQNIAQRLSLRQVFNPLVQAMTSSNDPGLLRDVVHGMLEASNGRREIPMPAEWPAAAKILSRHLNVGVREKAEMLSLIFGNADAVASLRQRVADPQALPAARRNALQALVQAKAARLAPLLQSLVSDSVVRREAIRGLAAYDDAATPKAILNRFSALTAEEKAEAINTLASRGNYAVALLESVKEGTVPARDISPFAARQIQALKDPRIAPLVSAALGEIRSVAKDKAAQIARYKQLLSPSAVKAANPSQGRALFGRTCAACHTLFGEGGTLAPELTGSQRVNLDYLLENVVDPNAVVWKQWRATYFETADGRLITGVVQGENESTVTIQTQTGSVTLPRKEIIKRTESELSMMPEGILDSLKPQEILDLVSYLQSPSPVALP